MTTEPLRLAGPVVAAILLAAAWPVSAYVAGPWLLPALLVAAGAAAVIAARLDAGIAIVLVLAPFTNAAIGGGRPLRVIVSGLAIIVLVTGLLVHRHRRRLSGTTNLPWFIVAFLATGAVSALAADDPAKSLPRFLGLVAATAVYFAVVVVCRRRDQLALVAGGAVAGLLLAGLQGASQKLTGRTSEAGIVVDGDVIGRVAGSFSHPNQFAGFLIGLVPLAVALAVSRSSPNRLRVLAGAAATLALAALAFSFTRGAVLGLAVGSLLWIAFARPRLAVPLAVAIALAGAAVAPGALGERLRHPTGDDIGLREDLWTSALDIYSTSPVLGVGLANFGEAYARLPVQLGGGTQFRLLHQSQLLVPPHANNLFLTVLAEEGLIGALAFVGLLGAALICCHRAAVHRDRFAASVGLGLGAGLCAMLVHSTLEYTLLGEPALPLYALLGVVTVLVTEPSASAP